MATLTVIVPDDLGNEFDISSGLVHLKINSTLVKDPTTGELGVAPSALEVSDDAGNVLVTGVDGRPFLAGDTIREEQTLITATEGSGFMTVTPGGDYGHAMGFEFDFNNVNFVEAVQDAIGAAFVAESGMEYDDVANLISSSLGNLSFGNGLVKNGATVSVKADANSPVEISVSAAGVRAKVVASGDADNLLTISESDERPYVGKSAVTDMATVEFVSLGGTPIGKGFPA